MTAQSKYDAIIVGGGLAGLVAAARLSEIRNKSILVVEAGPDKRGDPKIDIPGLLTSLWGDPEYDWDFYSKPQVTRSLKFTNLIVLNVCLEKCQRQGAASASRENAWGVLCHQCHGIGLSYAAQL